MPTSLEEQLEEANRALRRTVTDWVVQTGAPVTIRDVALDAPGGPGVEILPHEKRAASILLRFETPSELVLHLGRDSWWTLPPDPVLVRSLCEAVRRGRFSEVTYTAFGYLISSRGRLALEDETWTSTGGFGLPIGRRSETSYAPFPPATDA
jgi:hypothetical protein